MLVPIEGATSVALSPAPVPVPEPSTWLVGLGLIAAAPIQRRMKLSRMMNL
ncbi:MAG: PEP-CTERM sorting domain-containing protein [Isosphaeraceae bacterium]